MTTTATTYTLTIGGEDTTGLTATQAHHRACIAQQCGQPYTVHTADGRCVAYGNGHLARIDVDAATEYDDEIWLRGERR